MAAQYPRQLLKLQPHLWQDQKYSFWQDRRGTAFKNLSLLLASNPKLPPFATTKAPWKVYETYSEEKYNWQAFSVYSVI